MLTSVICPFAACIDPFAAVTVGISGVLATFVAFDVVPLHPAAIARKQSSEQCSA